MKQLNKTTHTHTYTCTQMHTANQFTQLLVNFNTHHQEYIHVVNSFFGLCFHSQTPSTFLSQLILEIENMCLGCFLWVLNFFQGTLTGSISLLKVKHISRTSLVAQWLRICLPMQGTWVRALVQEDPTCHGATKPVPHNCWACVPQLLKPTHLEPMLRNKRSHHNEKPTRCNEEQPLPAATRESPCTATKTQHSQK